ncbi:acyl-CoA dehydrogenase family protein [Streptomyces collinus]|uniref:acyl-CoA dehydrogenase family protein n=1 Tax=Streptomyces collinus TaxID=42684 RepID=UPI003631BCBF
MSSSPSSTAPSRSPLHELYAGRVPWQRLTSFPEPAPGPDRERGDAAVAALARLLRERVDPEEVERTGRLPEGLTAALREGGFLKLTTGPELGGLGLTPYHAFRVLEVAASRCTPVAFGLAITNGFGSGSYLPLLPEGPLKELIAGRVREGIVSAGADAEAIGTANERRATTAVPVDDGKFYEITGEKVFIGNGTVADLMDVSATVREPDGREEVRLLFVDSRTEGFEALDRHEFMGLRGAEIGRLRLDRVRVPAFHLLDESEESWRMRPAERETGVGAAPAAEAGAGAGGLRPGAESRAEAGVGAGGSAPGAHSVAEAGAEAGAEPGFVPTDFGQLAALGRILVIGPASLALARLCLHWSREFVRGRVIDGRGLGEYEEIRRRIAETAADVYTVDTVMTWVLHAHRFGDNQPELTAAKNLTSLACWRTADRTVSLLGGEGYETAASKARRGAQPFPVERAFRDARALRVAGGVDFMVDRWSAEAALSTCWLTGDPPDITLLDGVPAPDGAGLSPAGRGHLAFLHDQARELAATCARLSVGRSAEEVFRQQRHTTVLGRIGTELLGMALVLARAAARARQGDPAELPLADLVCATARLRLAALWPRLAEPDAAEPAYAAPAAAWLDGTGLDFLVRDVVTDLPDTTSPEKDAR